MTNAITVAAPQPQTLVAAPSAASDPLAMSSESFSRLRTMAEAAAACGLAHNPPAAFMKMVRGLELGLPATSSLQALHLVDGKIFPEASVLEALALQCPAVETMQLLELSDQRCRYRVKRKGWDAPIEVSWTMEDARRAGLLDRGPKSNWAKYPKAMLHARCRSQAARIVAPESLHAMASREEAEDNVATPPGLPAPSDAKEPLPGEVVAKQLMEKLAQVGTAAQLRTWRLDVRAAKQQAQISPAQYEALKSAHEERFGHPGGPNDPAATPGHLEGPSHAPSPPPPQPSAPSGELADDDQEAEAHAE